MFILRCSGNFTILFYSIFIQVLGFKEKKSNDELSINIIVHIKNRQNRCANLLVNLVFIVISRNFYFLFYYPKWNFSWIYSYIFGASNGNTSIENMKSLVPFLHQTCRNTIYPRSNVKRFIVPDQLVHWAETYAEYKPVWYESPHIDGASWADPAIGK